MSGRYPPLTVAEVEKILEKAGFYLDRSESSHFHWEGVIGGQRRLVTVDHFSGKKSVVIGMEILGFIIRQSGMTKKEFYSYL